MIPPNALGNDIRILEVTNSNSFDHAQDSIKFSSKPVPCQHKQDILGDSKRDDFIVYQNHNRPKFIVTG